MKEFGFETLLGWGNQGEIGAAFFFCFFPVALMDCTVVL
jgi:hypothetical protein